MRSLFKFIGSAALSGSVLLAMPTLLPAQTPAPTAAVPDFSGVYFNVQNLGVGSDPAKPGKPEPGAAPPPPPRSSAPVNDGSKGRPQNLPPLTEEYLAKYDVVAKSRTAGLSEYDSSAKCLPPGMPFMMGMVYGMEIMQTRDRITIFSEWMDALRRIYIDGRKPMQKHLDDPTFAGYSTGHWEGDTLVVETVAIRPDGQLDGLGSPHSDQTTVTERIRFVGPGLLEDRMTVKDPKAFTRPWESTRTYRRASPPNDELREFACAEGLVLAPGYH
jgi:hypothetical protein